MRNAGIVGTLIWTIIWAVALIGYVKCWVKFVKCDFKEPVKAEVIYGIGCFTGLGVIIGWINIEDEAPDQAQLSDGKVITWAQATEIEK